jgi:hypothetical protein
MHVPLKGEGRKKNFTNSMTNYGNTIFTQRATHLQPGDYMESDNGRIKLVFQNDGNLVLTHVSDGVIWAANCHGQGGNSFNIQRDGNAVVYNTAGPIWSTGTYQSNEAYWHKNRFVLQNDGNLVMYYEGPPQHRPVWASGTNRY